jgi:hypothetical protein
LRDNTAIFMNAGKPVKIEVAYFGTNQDGLHKKEWLALWTSIMAIFAIFP